MIPSHFILKMEKFKMQDQDRDRNFVSNLITEKESYYMRAGKCTLSYNLSSRYSSFIKDPTPENKELFLKALAELRQLRIIEALYKEAKKREKNFGIIMTVENDEKRRAEKSGPKTGISEDEARLRAERLKEKIANYSKKQLK